MIKWTEKSVSLDELRPYERNPRKMTQAGYDRLKKSIAELGYHQRIIVQPNMAVIGGHQRIRALKDLGIETVNVLIPDRELEIEEFRRLLVQDNLAFGDFDMEILAVDFQKEELIDWGMQPDILTDFQSAGTEGLTDPDSVLDPPANPVTKLGDVWICGNHRIICGDSTDAGTVKLLMNGAKACLMQTDPPYGIAYVQNAKTKGQSIGHTDIENDELDREKLQAFLESAIKAAIPFLTESCAFYLWHPMLTQGTFFAAADILIHRQIIWVKPSLVFGRGDYHWRHELCFYEWVRGHRAPFYGARNQTTIWEIGRETSKQHPTAKPVDLWMPPIDNHTKAGDVIYEPFCGSGSQIIAAEMTARHCYAIELSPAYVDVAVKRWQDFTGKTGTLESNGNTFDEQSVLVVPQSGHKD